MIKLKSSRNYIIIKDKKELELAKACDLCLFIIWEQNNAIVVWEKLFGKWVKNKYVVFDKSKDKDDETTGLKAYQSFYAYCGKTEVERMKGILKPIPMWDSYEQMHYSNIEFMEKKLYQNIYEFDANSAFTYGVTKLPEGFELLKEYMISLYEMKEQATNQITRAKYKNLQNFLIGYFARVTEFVRVRSEVIYNSNDNIQRHMAKIIKNGGTCFISNTDSIVTDDKGAEVMLPILGSDVGQFKLSTKTDRLFYKSANIYQLGDKVVYSGVSYFARKHTDFFKDRFAEQKGTLIEGYDFYFNLDNDEYNKLCRVKNGEIKVTIFNKIGEVLDELNYKLGG